MVHGLVGHAPCDGAVPNHRYAVVLALLQHASRAVSTLTISTQCTRHLAATASARVSCRLMCSGSLPPARWEAVLQRHCIRAAAEHMLAAELRLVTHTAPCLELLAVCKGSVHALKVAARHLEVAADSHAQGSRHRG